VEVSAVPDSKALMPSKRLIRQQSLLQRLSSYPHDLLISLNEAYELLEWDSLSSKLSIPIGVGLNAVYLLARLDQDDQTSSYREKDIFEGSRIRGSRTIFDKQSNIHTLVNNDIKLD
jgi:hypothetical protein